MVISFARTLSGDDEMMNTEELQRFFF